jgi:hypothetical protein
MNRAFLIILIPAILVIAGYSVVLRMMGFAPGYSRLLIAAVVLLGAIYWLSRKSPRGANSRQR